MLCQIAGKNAHLKTTCHKISQTGLKSDISVVFWCVVLTVKHTVTTQYHPSIAPALIPSVPLNRDSPTSAEITKGISRPLWREGGNSAWGFPHPLTSLQDNRANYTFCDCSLLWELNRWMKDVQYGDR
jgi:hypothetical protein